MRITDAGVGLSPWRRRVLPILLVVLRAAAAFVVLHLPLGILLNDPMFFRGLAPPAAQYVLAAVLALGGVLFVCSPTVVAGAVTGAVGLAVYEYGWARSGAGVASRTFVTSVALLAVLAAGEWVGRRLQRRVYGPPERRGGGVG